MNTTIGGLGRDCIIPGFAVRPGAVAAFGQVGEAILLWQIIHTINGRRHNACYASETELGHLLCRSRGAARRRLDGLRAVPGLLLEVKRPPITRSRLPTVFRWATDPFAVDWYYTISNYRLPELAEQFGLDGDWLMGATKHLAQHSTKSKVLADEIKPDLFKSMPSESVQDGEGKGKESEARQLKPGRGAVRPRRPRQNRGALKKKANEEERRRGRGAGLGEGQRAC